MEPIFIGMAEELNLEQPDIDMEELLKEQEEKNDNPIGNERSGDSPRDGESNQSDNA